MEKIEVKTEPRLTIKQEELDLTPIDEVIKSEEVELKQELPEAPFEELYRCSECLLKFKLRWSLLRHIKKHHPHLTSHKSFKCSKCSYKAVSGDCLKKHSSACHEKRFECRFCPFRTKFNHRVVVHVKMRHKGGENEVEEIWERCSKCFFRTKDKTKLERHVKMRHRVDKEVFYCTLCDFKSASLYKCKVHRRKNHPEEFRFFCEYCFYSTKEKSRLKNHVIKKHLTSENVVWYKCKSCKFRSNEKREITSHCCQPQKIKPEIEEKLKDLDLNFRFVCDRCDYKTNMPGEFKRHQSCVHTALENIKWLECDQCDFKTKQRGNLTKHKDAKHVPLDEIKWIQCPHCPYRAKTKDLFKKHQTCKHSDFFKSFKCEQCDFTTKRKYALKIHVTLKHTSDDLIKWFECAQCTYRGKSKYSLKQHEANMHSNRNKPLKDFKCEFCEHSCSRRYHLKLHVAAKHKVQWLECDQCDFKTPNTDFESHVKTHDCEGFLGV